MKVLCIDYNMYGKADIIQAFRILGNEVDSTEIPMLHGEKTEKTRSELSDLMGKKHYDIVFTSNYYPIVSDLCEIYKSKYISWTYDSPRISLYDRSILNKCNYAFVFDSYECNALRNKGVKTVFYMPLGINPERINAIKVSDKDRELYTSDIGMVASLYNEKHNLYDRMYDKLDDYTKGYLESTLNVQKNLFGTFILEEAICDEKILSSMYKAMPYVLSKDSIASLTYIYAYYFLARKTAYLQRIEYIKAISSMYEMKVYSPGDLSKISTVKHMGTVDYETDMYKVFQLSKINLNITLPSIHTGIPLRAMDIMGAGGFLLTNYQADFDVFFEPGVDYVYYTSLKEALDLIDYYLNHEDERNTISQNAKNKMEQCFTYTKLIEQMIEIAEKNMGS